MITDRLNFHHLHYFWAVAKDGNLTRTARRLHVSQSALSAQIRQLEARLGEPLFLRQGRRLTLTEAGRVALDCAEDIFGAGDELLAKFTRGRLREDVFRLGAVATLSRNFQESFVMPLLEDASVRLRIHSGGFDDLLDRLAQHELDLVLSNRPARKERGHAFRNRRVARQGVSLVGRPRARPFRFPRDLGSARLLLPGPDSDVRREFDAMCEELGVQVNVLAEVDDMATMRLLARDSTTIALLPSVVVRDELRAGTLRELCAVPDLFETFYAITTDRRFPHPLLRSLFAREGAAILAMDGEDPSSR